MPEDFRLDDILDAFDRVSRAEWLSKIERDLRGKSIAEVAFSPESGMDINPFQHDEDLDRVYGAALFNPSWEIAEVFPVTDPSCDNHLLLDALRGGVQFLVLEVACDPDWSVLFKDVDLSLIGTRIVRSSSDSPAISNAVRRYIENTYGGQPIDWAMRPGDPDNSILFQHIETGGRTAEAYALTLTTILDELEAIDGACNVEIQLDIGSNVLFEIARIRALKMLWTDIRSACGREDTSMTLEVHFRDDTYDGEEYTNMIRAASMSLAAICGGADRLAILPAGGSNDSNTRNRRIARNIHHLMKYESRLDKVRDPVEGALFFEKVAGRIFDDTWKLLKSA